MNTSETTSASAATAADSPASSPSSASAFSSSSTRKGKIARLPKRVRDELNERLDDGVPGTELVRWLNGLSEVQRVMKDQFQGQPITEQNLSAWKVGGFRDWLAHEERRDWISRISEEAEDLQGDAGRLPLLERIGTQMELLLGRAVEQMLGRELNLDSPQEMKRLLALSQEVARHRKLALAAAKVRDEKLRREAREEAEDAPAEADEDADERKSRRRGEGAADDEEEVDEDEELMTSFDGEVMGVKDRAGRAMQAVFRALTAAGLKGNG